MHDGRDAKYQSLRQDILRTLYMRLVPSLDRLVREVDPALRVRTVRTYRAVVDQSIATERTMAALGGVSGVLALLVAALGVFGVLAFQVAGRTNELGVRMALGASRRTVMGLVLREVIVMVVAGVSIGAAGALVSTGLARTMLFGLTPTDPGMFVVAASVLAVTAIFAGWLPARRASRVDPLVALRDE
jgi:ABC-type antimicrobial peptide transport system permease subunit